MDGFAEMQRLACWNDKEKNEALLKVEDPAAQSLLNILQLRRLLGILLLDAMQYPVIIEMRQRKITTDDYAKQNTKRKDSRETLIFINIECCN